MPEEQIILHTTVIFCQFWVIRELPVKGDSTQYPQLTFEPHREKTGFLHMRKQRRRTASG